ncbi:MAG: Asp-tRNA(Asn)/Glu-tRNA(Gln) amidotransferase subunit GatC [Candidatus Aenigmatarchaeota archaeon]
MKKKKEHISVDAVRHVAKLARLELSEAEVKKFSKDLNDILVAFKDLDAVKISKSVQPSFQPLPIKDVLREDKVDECLTHEKAMANTKHKEKGFFKGPRAV